MDIKDIDFSSNTQEVNDALIKLQAMFNLEKVPDRMCEGLTHKLLGSQEQRDVAIENIEDLETERIYPFCTQYLEEIIRLKKEKNQVTPFHLKQALRIIKNRDAGYQVFSVKNNASFSEEYAEGIKAAAQNDPSSKIRIEISNTKNLDKNTVNLLQDCSNVQFHYLGKHPYQAHNIDEFYTPKELSECLTKMEHIEKNINPEWSDTAKALYIFRHLYHSCNYGPSVSMAGVFLENNSVCQGFSVAYKELMDRQNIDCKICMSESASHLFNEVKLNNKWVPVDVSDATEWYKKVKLSSEKVDSIDFGSKQFISHLPQSHQNHHQTSGRYMKSEGNDISHLTQEEYSAAMAEISSAETSKEILQGQVLKLKTGNAK